MLFIYIHTYIHTYIFCSSQLLLLIFFFIKYLCVAAVFFCIFQRWTSGYIFKRGRLKLRVVLASRKEVTESEENMKEDDREILEEDKEVRQEIVEFQEEDDGDDRQEYSGRRG